MLCGKEAERGATLSCFELNYYNNEIHLKFFLVNYKKISHERLKRFSTLKVNDA